MTKKGKFALLISIAWLLAGDVAGAQTASALVLEKRGASNPEVQPYTEIPVGKTVSLSPGARLIFQHYHTCRTVTVAGGAIRFEAEAYTVTGGNKEKETPTPCPQKVSLRAGGEAAGILMRSMVSRTTADPLTLSPRPTFVLVGSHADDFASVRVSRGGREVLNSPLHGRRFQWPKEAASLSTEGEYEMALIPAVAGTAPVRKTFRVRGPTAAQTGKGLLLIRVE